MKKAKRYREDFLTKVRYVTDDLEKASKSFFQYSEVKGGQYGLSVLGIINGFLYKFTPFVLLANLDNEQHGRIIGYNLRRRWW